ncbi:MAG: sulfate adenylyltransferase subunit 1 [Acidimicrobiales bacterium]
MDLVRLATAGSVDDGKSTLIGRLLHDTKSLPADTLASLERLSIERGLDHLELALVTDGLRAEREQGITIDVAHRSFQTRRRRFLLADCPGHLQYTRNMVTGASDADIAVVLVDARHGLMEQSRRHAFLAALLGVRHLVIAVNKMDLVGFAAEVFERIRAEFEAYSAKLEVQDVAFVPISALHGDNVVARSPSMLWYEGATLLHHLESVHVAADRNFVDARFPVQLVLRPRTAEHPDYRGYAGRMSSGVLRVGDEVVALPAGLTTRVVGLEVAGRAVAEIAPPLPATVRLADDIDLGRGDLLCRPRNRPTVTQDLSVLTCWMDDRSELAAGRALLVKHTTRTVRAVVRSVDYRVDIDTLHRVESPESLRSNDIGRVTLRTAQPVMVDPYHRNRETGSLVLIDPQTNATVAGALVR